MQNRRKKPPWWNEDVSNTKRQVNISKKSFRQRRTPRHFQELKEKEVAEVVTKEG